MSVFWGKVKDTFSCKNYSILEINYSAISCNLKLGIKIKKWHNSMHQLQVAKNPTKSLLISERFINLHSSKSGDRAGLAHQCGQKFLPSFWPGSLLMLCCFQDQFPHYHKIVAVAPDIQVSFHECIIRGENLFLVFPHISLAREIELSQLACNNYDLPSWTRPCVS